MLAQAERLTESAERSGSIDTALRGIGQVRAVLELLGEVSGELSGKGTSIGIINLQPQVAPNFKEMTNEQLQQVLKRNGYPVPLLEAQITGDPQ